MATTTQLRIRANNGESNRETLKKRLNYITNPLKTDGGKYVTYLNCSEINTDIDFAMTIDLYNEVKGRERKPKDILAYHVRQAFKPGEVTPELAHEIGKKLVDKYIGSNDYECVISTHIDKEHIHNHIIFNSHTLDGTRKFQNEKDTAYRIRSLSDELCREYGLSVIESPKPRIKGYKEWEAERKGTSWKAAIKKDIDIAISMSNTFADFLESMSQKGYEMKFGAHMAFRPKGKERFVRGYKLGEEYSEEKIKYRIENQKKQSKEEKSTSVQKRVSNNGLIRKYPLSFVSQLAARDKVISKAYFREQKERLQHIQAVAEKLRLLSAENIKSYEQLQNRIKDILVLQARTQDTLKALDNKIERARLIARAAATMATHNAVYDEYQKSLFKEKYRRDNLSAILLYEAAKEQLHKMGITAAVEPNDLLATYQNAKAERAELQGKYNNLKSRLDALRDTDKMINNLLVKQSEKTRDDRNKSNKR